jgi:hypothetical protein
MTPILLFRDYVFALYFAFDSLTSPIQRFEHCPTPGAKRDKTRVIPGFIFVIVFGRVG